MRDRHMIRLLERVTQKDALPRIPSKGGITDSTASHGLAFGERLTVSYSEASDSDPTVIFQKFYHQVLDVF
jgi:hypothetical protein